MADTVGYANDIVKHTYDRSVPQVWDFGHLLWRPLGSLVCGGLQLLNSSSSVSDGDARKTVLAVLVVLSWMSGFVCVLTLVAILTQFFRERASITLTSLAFIFSQAFLNFSRAGTSYIPGLCFLLTGIFLLLRRNDGQSSLAPLWAGCALAVSALLWLPYVLSIPAALVSPLFILDNNRRWRCSLLAAAAFTIVSASVYGLVMLHLRIVNTEGLASWIAMSTWAAGVGGAKRAVFGLARSFINMGNDGLLFKRFLAQDPYNPVSVPQLFRLTLAKIVFFYAFMAGVVLCLARSRIGKNILGLLAINAATVGIFAVLWYGGDMERYLPLYPVLFLGICASMNVRGYEFWFRTLTIAFLAVIGLSNAIAMANFTINRDQQRVVERTRELLPYLTPQSRVFVHDTDDQLYAFSRNSPFHPLNRSGNFQANAILIPGTRRDLHWQQSFAVLALAVWDQHGTVWISKRVLSARPLSEWNWVEGSDSRVRWKDTFFFFSDLDWGTSVGSTDGFVLLLPTQKNRGELTQFLAGASV
jgi:hypothetical protein